MSKPEFVFSCVRCQAPILVVCGEPNIVNIRTAERQHQTACFGPIPLATLRRRKDLP